MVVASGTWLTDWPTRLAARNSSIVYPPTNPPPANRAPGGLIAEPRLSSR